MYRNDAYFGIGASGFLIGTSVNVGSFEVPAIAVAFGADEDTPPSPEIAAAYGDAPAIPPIPA